MDDKFQVKIVVLLKYRPSDCIFFSSPEALNILCCTTALRDVSQIIRYSSSLEELVI